MVEGEILGNSIDMRLNGKANIEQFELDAGTDTMMTDKASFKYSFSGIGNENLFEKFHASLVPDVNNFAIDGLFLNKIDGKINIDNDSSDFGLSMFIDSTAQVDIEGKSNINANMMEFEIPRLKTEIGQYNAENKDTVRFILGCNGFSIKALTLTHEEEEAILAGCFSPTGISDLNITLNKFHLSDLKQILHRGPYAKSSTQLDGVMNAITSFRGSFKHPNIAIDVHADDVCAIDLMQNKQKILGKIDSRISYFEYILGLDVKFTNRSDDPEAVPYLLLSGSLPYNFVLLEKRRISWKEMSILH